MIIFLAYYIRLAKRIMMLKIDLQKTKHFDKPVCSPCMLLTEGVVFPT